MAYYLEIKFSDANQKWQRNPSPFSTREEADLAGRQFVAKNQMDPKMRAKMYDITRDSQFAPTTENVIYRVIEIY